MALLARPGARWALGAWSALPASPLKRAARGLCSPSGLNPENVAQGLLGGNRFSLSKAITLVESTREDHRKMGSQILEMVLQGARKAREGEEGATAAGNPRGSFRIGISGPPGVGKSTFIEALGLQMINKGHKIAVIAVDPSSHLSGGSILGDKTRMNELAMRKEAFVRPCATSGHLGGIAQHTDEVVLLCESAGYDLVLIETVGVGQSEILVSEISDMFMLLLPPAGGDALQGIKRGIVEAADLVVINKADGDLLLPAKRAQAEYRNGLHYINSPRPWWRPDVVTCSALKNTGIDKVFELAGKFWKLAVENGSLEASRGGQRAKWMWNKAEDEAVRALRASPAAAQCARDLQESLARGEHSSRWAAERLIERFLEEQRKGA